MKACRQSCNGTLQTRLARPPQCVRPSCAGTGNAAQPVYDSRRITHRQLHTRGAGPPAALAAAGALPDDQSVVARIKRRLTQALVSHHDKEILSVAFPAFIGLALEPVVNAFNAGLVGHLGTQQLSAVSLGSIAMNSAIFLFSFLLFLTVPEVAAAVVKNDDEEVSRVTAQSLWVALGCGCLTAAAVGLNAAKIVAALNPPEAAVAAMATQYMQIRSLSIPSALLGFVATGVFRGFKDTRTPLAGTAASVALSLVMHLLLLNVLRMGVLGAALASTAASFASSALLTGALLAGRKVLPRHLKEPPPLSAVLPLLQRGMVLGAKNMVTFGMIMFASTLCARRGSAFQASFEVLRQMWMITMPFFECASVATQALCATALGQQDVPTAVSLLLRLLLLGTCVGGLAGAAVWAAHPHLIAAFTRDPEVVRHVMSALPLICIFFPIDAAGSIMDGSLLAAKQSNYMSAVQIAGSVVQYFALMYVARSGDITTFGIWAAIKIMPTFRLLGGTLGNFVSRGSAYRQRTAHQGDTRPDSESSDTAAAVAAAAADTASELTSIDSNSGKGSTGALGQDRYQHQQQPLSASVTDAAGPHAQQSPVVRQPASTAAAAAAPAAVAATAAAAAASAANAAAAAVAAAAASAAVCSGGDGAVAEVEMAVAAALVEDVAPASAAVMIPRKTNP